MGLSAASPTLHSERLAEREKDTLAVNSRSCLLCVTARALPHHFIHAILQVCFRGEYFVRAG